MYKGKRVSVVIPCHNEEEGIRITLSDMPRALVDEVVVVDNNCSDNTSEVALSLGARVVTETRKGYGAAYKAGSRYTPFPTAERPGLDAHRRCRVSKHLLAFSFPRRATCSRAGARPAAQRH